MEGGLAEGGGGGGGEPLDGGVAAGAGALAGAAADGGTDEAGAGAGVVVTAGAEAGDGVGADDGEGVGVSLLASSMERRRSSRSSDPAVSVPGFMIQPTMPVDVETASQSPCSERTLSAMPAGSVILTGLAVSGRSFISVAD